MEADQAATQAAAAVCARNRSKNRFNVVVYCGSSVGNNPEYARQAEVISKALVERSTGIVFGGSNFGLLGVMAAEAVKNNGIVTGIIPEFFLKCDGYKAVGEEVVVKDMHTRKKMMFDNVDGFIALPGGLGTMEELTEIMTWNKLDLHDRPMAILNTLGYYDHFIKWLERSIEDGFIKANTPEDILIVKDDPIALVEAMIERMKKNEVLGNE